MLLNSTKIAITKVGYFSVNFTTIKLAKEDIRIQSSPLAIGVFHCAFGPDSDIPKLTLVYHSSRFRSEILITFYYFIYRLLPSIYQHNNIA